MKPTSSDRATADESPADTESAGDALRGSIQQLTEAFAYAGHYVSARIDGFKLSLRTMVVYIVLCVLGLIAATAFLTTSVVLLVIGLARWLGSELGNREWLGDVIVGAAVLGGVGLFLTIVVLRLRAVTRRRTVSKYEARRNHQRETFGHDVADRAAATGRVSN